VDQAHGLMKTTTMKAMTKMRPKTKLTMMEVNQLVKGNGNTIIPQ
jgi:hypothetical protein